MKPIKLLYCVTGRLGCIGCVSLKGA